MMSLPIMSEVKVQVDTNGLRPVVLSIDSDRQ